MKSLTFSQLKHNTMHPRRVNSSKGFSIVEVAIAMGVVTLLLTTFLGVFGPAQKNIQRALSTKDASRMKDTLSNEMSILRSTDTDASSFAKAFRMISSSHAKVTAVLMYQYRADPEDTDNDGILPAFTGTDGIQGKDYIIQTAVRTLGVSEGSDDDIKDELKVVDGPVFVVRMTQLVKDTSDSSAGKLVLTARESPAAGITDPDTPGADITDPALYPKAVIAFRAEFFQLSANKFGFINSNNWDFDRVGNAVTEVNMAIRR